MDRLSGGRPAGSHDLVDLLERQVNHKAGSALYSFLGKNLSIRKHLSYADVYIRAKRLAARLQARSIQRQPVILLYRHDMEFLVAFWGCILAGAWPAPLSRGRGLGWSSLSSIIKHSGARSILTSTCVSKLIPEDLLSACGVQVMLSNQHADDTGQWEHPSPKASDTAFIQFSSGSTSRPKGAVITHGNVLDNLARIHRAFACSEQDRGLSWLPFHHDMGLIGHVLQPLYAGIHNYFLSPMDFLSDPARWLKAISRHQITISGGPNFAYSLCNEKIAENTLRELDLSQWRLAYCGSEKLQAGTLQRFAGRTHASKFQATSFYPCYGMAEATLFVCGIPGLHCATSQQSMQACLSVGDTSADSHRDEQTDIRVINPNNHTECPNGVIGEIWLRSASIAAGYYNDIAASSRAFDQDILDTQGQTLESGFFRTGDMGFLEKGKLYFSGRLKNLIKHRGRTCYAEDVEAVLESCLRHRGIKRCAALGIEEDNTEALVILLERVSGSAPDHEDVLCQVAASLTCQQTGILPQAVHALPANSLPLTTSGKLQRPGCQALYFQHLRPYQKPRRTTYASQ